MNLEERNRLELTSIIIDIITSIITSIITPAIKDTQHFDGEYIQTGNGNCAMFVL